MNIKPFLEGSESRKQMLWRRQKSRQWNYLLALMSVQTRDIQKVMGDSWLWLWLSFATQENLLTSFFSVHRTNYCLWMSRWKNVKLFEFDLYLQWIVWQPVSDVSWCSRSCSSWRLALPCVLAFPLCVLAVFHHLNNRWAFQCVWLQTVFKHQCDGAFDYDSFIRSQSLVLTSRRWIIHRWKKSKGLKW